MFTVVLSFFLRFFRHDQMHITLDKQEFFSLKVHEKFPNLLFIKANGVGETAEKYLQ